MLFTFTVAEVVSLDYYFYYFRTVVYKYNHLKFVIDRGEVYLTFLCTSKTVTIAVNLCELGL